MLSVVAATAALVLAGCGGDDDRGVAPAVPVTPPAGTAEGPPGDAGDASDDDGGVDDVDDGDVTGDVTGGADATGGDAIGGEGAPAILQISAPLVGGGELDLATIGDRPVLLWFWAPF